MKIILDTCTFLWICTDDEKLSANARKLFRDPGNEVYLSVISSWEICLKYGLEKLPLPEPPERYVPSRRRAHRIDLLLLDEAAVFQISKLPPLHRDPFDRMLVAQAVAEGAALLTPDPSISQYAVHVEW